MKRIIDAEHIPAGHKTILVHASGKSWGPYSNTMERKLHPDDNEDAKAAAYLEMDKFIDLCLAKEIDPQPLVDGYFPEDMNDLTWRQIMTGYIDLQHSVDDDYAEYQQFTQDLRHG